MNSENAKQEVKVDSIKFTPIYPKRETIETEDSQKLYTQEDAKNQWKKLSKEERSIFDSFVKAEDMERATIFMSKHKLPAQIRIDPETRKPIIVEP